MFYHQGTAANPAICATCGMTVQEIMATGQTMCRAREAPCTLCGHAQGAHNWNYATGVAEKCAQCLCLFFSAAAQADADLTAAAQADADPPAAPPEADPVAAAPAQADCECGHPRKFHWQNDHWACHADAACECQGFRLAASKVAALGECYVCGARGHATGACPYYPHRTP